MAAAGVRARKPRVERILRDHELFAAFDVRNFSTCDQAANEINRRSRRPQRVKVKHGRLHIEELPIRRLHRAIVFCYSRHVVTPSTTR